MASPSYVESLVSSAKRLRISAPRRTSIQQVQQHRFQSQVAASSQQPQRNANASVSTHQSRRTASHTAQRSETPDLLNVRLPKAVQAVFLEPLKRAPTHGIPVCDLQIRSYSVRNLELFTDFCLRAAYYLNLPAKGPIPLPRITERWTVPRANFIHKKSQENFERITLRRLIQIQDGNSETVAIWLAYVQKNRYYGVGMKANVFEHGSLNVVSDLEAEADRLQDVLGESLQLFGTRPDPNVSDEQMNEVIHDQPFKAAWATHGVVQGKRDVPHAREHLEREKVNIAQRYPAPAPKDQFAARYPAGDAEKSAAQAESGEGKTPSDGATSSGDEKPATADKPTAGA